MSKVRGMWQWAALFPALLLLLVPAALSAPGDMVIPRKEGSFSEETLPASNFPHWVHRARYRCDACHRRLFEMELGVSEITMDMMKQGESCGACHNGQAAFEISFQTCNRCHAGVE